MGKGIRYVMKGSEIGTFLYARHYSIKANLRADGRTSIMGRNKSGFERSRKSLGGRRCVSLV